MVLSRGAEVLCDGQAEGEVLRLNAPISFWGGIDPKTARITLDGHPQLGLSVQGKVLVLPELIGSSSSSAVLLELIYQGKSPAALILGTRDAILPIGVLVAEQMGWRTMPVLLWPDAPFQTHQRLVIEPGGDIELVQGA